MPQQRWLAANCHGMMDIPFASPATRFAAGGVGFCRLSPTPNFSPCCEPALQAEWMPLPGASSLQPPLNTAVLPQVLGVWLPVTSCWEVTSPSNGWIPTHGPSQCCEASSCAGARGAGLRGCQLPPWEGAGASHPSLSMAFAGRDGDVAGPPVPEAHRALCPRPGVFQPRAEPPVPAAPGQAAAGPRKLLGAGGHWDGHRQWLGHTDALLPPVWGLAGAVPWCGVASPCFWHGLQAQGCKGWPKRETSRVVPIPP